VIGRILGHSGKGGVNSGALLSHQLALQRSRYEFIATAGVSSLDCLIHSGQ
jgi:hypothetical protein